MDGIRGAKQQGSLTLWQVSNWKVKKFCFGFPEMDFFMKILPAINQILKSIFVNVLSWFGTTVFLQKNFTERYFHFPVTSRFPLFWYQLETADFFCHHFENFGCLPSQSAPMWHPSDQTNSKNKQATS